MLSDVVNLDLLLGEKKGMGFLQGKGQGQEEEGGGRGERKKFERSGKRNTQGAGERSENSHVG